MPPTLTPSKPDTRRTRPQTAPPRMPMLFSRAEDRHRFERMMQQQFWLWGCDVRRPDGNLLALHGFEKQRPPEGSTCSTSRYARVVSGDIELALWGFGLLATRAGDGSVFLPRLSLRPRCAECHAALDGRWDPDDFTDLHRPSDSCDHRRVRLLLADVLRWIETYEREVLDVAGVAFRSASVAAWKRPIGPAQDLPQHWIKLASTLQAEGNAFTMQ
ncbi:MAG: hypothetical protein QM753_08340 [Thermomicrobiales bacterium]